MACSATTTRDSNIDDSPVVVRDARFGAGRSLVAGDIHEKERAIDIFAALLESARSSFGGDHVECAPAYYEYGNALFRHYLQQQHQREQAEGYRVDDMKQEDDVTMHSKHEVTRSAAALAAEKRLAASEVLSSTTKSNQAIVDEGGLIVHEKGDHDEQPVSSAQNEDPDNNDQEENSDDDLQLALEMMETGWSVLDGYMSSDFDPDHINKTNETARKRYFVWGLEQMPRWLTGIGDVLSAMDRHPDAADVYSRALELRQTQWQALEEASTKQSQEHSPQTQALLLEKLTMRRKMTETLILIAEEFLASPEGEDMVTTETKNLLCRASERIEYARGYYDKARDELQETVLLMGQLAMRTTNNAAKTKNTVNDKMENRTLEQQKEDVCFASMLVMNVGEKLAEHDELQQAEQDSPNELANKKARR